MNKAKKTHITVSREIAFYKNRRKGEGIYFKAEVYVSKIDRSGEKTYRFYENVSPASQRRVVEVMYKLDGMEA